eukprot:gnl/Dysnectes_brevis/9833_a18690_156.p1 GENE.gnl/Dysnectes_brevis/9833_a18690_156~~gnl/Dysnectes_brevis/9833_a18690_156.p1  ORF type:complete len:437 (+),score=65.96 gnl/Dysnectes_brevis/9833_a18690_156:60-1370(+)
MALRPKLHILSYPTLVTSKRDVLETLKPSFLFKNDSNTLITDDPLLPIPSACLLPTELLPDAEDVTYFSSPITCICSVAYTKRGRREIPPSILELQMESDGHRSILASIPLFVDTEHGDHHLGVSDHRLGDKVPGQGSEMQITHTHVVGVARKSHIITTHITPPQGTSLFSVTVYSRSGAGDLFFSKDRQFDVTALKAESQTITVARKLVWRDPVTLKSLPPCLTLTSNTAGPLTLREWTQPPSQGPSDAQLKPSHISRVCERLLGVAASSHPSLTALSRSTLFSEGDQITRPLRSGVARVSLPFGGGFTSRCSVPPPDIPSPPAQLSLGLQAPAAVWLGESFGVTLKASSSMSETLRLHVRRRSDVEGPLSLELGCPTWSAGVVPAGGMLRASGCPLLPRLQGRCTLRGFEVVDVGSGCTWCLDDMLTVFVKRRE